MTELRTDHFQDHKKRSFVVVETSPGSVTLSEQGTSPAVWWDWVPPLSVSSMMEMAARAHGLPNELGLTITGHMPGGPETMMWQVSYENAKERLDEIRRRQVPTKPALFTVRAIAKDAAGNRLGEAQAETGVDEPILAANDAYNKVADLPWHTVEFVLERKENVR